MLIHLSIRNIVLIEACDIVLEAGFCVLTGETGAGKSILLDALGLALGARGDAMLVRGGADSGSVTAEFIIRDNTAARATLEALGFPADDVLIIRRTLAADGKTRCFVNDAPVGVSALRALSETLVEVHGQHDQRGLLDAATHRALLDAYGQHESLSAEVQALYAAWTQVEAALAALQKAIAEGAREEEYLRHMVNELKQLDPKPGEEEELAQTRTRMMQSEKLFETLNEALSELNAGKGVAGMLGSVERLLVRSTLNADNRFAPAIEALERASAAAEDAIVALETMGREATYDPKRLEEMEERLFAIKAAARKYNLSADELPSLREEAAARLALVASREQEVAKLSAQTKAAKEAYAKAAEKLSAKRAAAAKKLCASVQDELAPLKMEGARFHIRIDPLEENAWSAHGREAIAFEAATNVTKKTGVVYAPLSKIASGGELSRFMLALKVAMSGVRSTPTLIFDEIDAGTGGAVAAAMGLRLAQLGKAAQVLVVTHLPQVAARGSQHLKVEKAESRGRVQTSVDALSAADRREEVARMLAGSTITPEARKAAAKLLEQAA